MFFPVLSCLYKTLPPVLPPGSFFLYLVSKPEAMPNIKFSVNINKTNKTTGLAPIRATISFQGKNHRKNIELVKPAFWNKLKQRVKPNREGTPDNRHKTINKLLDDYQAKTNAFFNDCALQNVQLTEKIIVDFLDGKEFSKSKPHDFNTIFLEFLTTTKVTKAPRTYTNHVTVFNYLTQYQEYKNTRLTLNDIDLSFFDGLQDYSFNIRKTQTNYFAKITAVLKTFLNWSAEREYYTGTKHLKFKAPEKNIDTIALTIEEFQQLYSFNYENPRHERVRDVFCFGCLTGLRFSDLKELRRENIKNGYIEMVIQKTKNPAKIPLLTWAQSIIDKYSLEATLLPVISPQKYNVYLKECCELAGIDQPTQKTTYIGNKAIKTTKPKYKLISAHASRKTFVTLFYSLGMDVKMIKAITGHTQDRTFDKYLKIEDEKKKTEINKAWRKVPSPKENMDDDISDEDLVSLIKESRKSGKGNINKIMDFLRSQEDPEPEK